MRHFKHILLPSHGTRGAQAAERRALNLCDAGTVLHHFIVVPDLWKGMMGDDWLNNASVRDDFGKYVESELTAEIELNIERLLRKTGKRDIRYRHEVILGKPSACLMERARRGPVDLVVMGSPRPKGETGLRSRMLTEALARELPVPLLIVPYPHDKPVRAQRR